MKTSFTISGNIVDVVKERIFKGKITVEQGKIVRIDEGEVDSDQYIMPGFVDAHIHIESSMLSPVEFAKASVIYGTVACVADPHEIANVLGIEGVRFMIKEGESVPFKFFFGAPSCVPATSFESSGAKLTSLEIEELFKNKEVSFLAEMMNFPGVVFNDVVVMTKIAIAQKYNKPIDGHAPGLMGEQLKTYADAGITTDHECMNIDEALAKIEHGMKIQIREGSAAKNFDDLISLAKTHSDKIMFCSDDKHPDDLLKGHLNLLFKRAVEYGINPIKVAKILSYNPIKHYSLNVGLLQKGDFADFIVFDNFDSFNVRATYINGEKVAEDGKSFIQSNKNTACPNLFNVLPLEIKDIQIEAKSNLIKVIEVEDGQLYTKAVIEKAKIENNFVVSDTDADVLKMVVINRYIPSKPAIGFIKNIGFKQGAIASSIAHDSHNIVAVGVSDKDIVKAINSIIDVKGGICVVDEKGVQVLPLPIAGLMSDKGIVEVANLYESINNRTIALGTSLKSPFMTISFMSLLVIPELKLSDKGLFDGIEFSFTNLFA